MKRILTVVTAMMMARAALGQPYVYNNTASVNTAIPENDPDGLASTMDVEGLAAAIDNVTVSLDISGGYNGDLYGYLSGPEGGFAVLLNRVGEGVGSGESAYGYSDSGLDVTFDDSSTTANIHTYQQSGAYPGDVVSGQVTGTWNTDGENISPLSSPSAYMTASEPPTQPGSATLLSFESGSVGGNGTWTLFLANLAEGNQSTLVSWSLDITTVPEPTTLGLGALGIGMIAARKLLRRK